MLLRLTMSPANWSTLLKQLLQCVRQQETFLTDLHWKKKKSGRAGKPCFDIPKLWPTTLINSPAGVRVQERTSWCWQISFRNDSGCGQIKNRKATTRFSQRGALFPFLNTGPAGGEPSVESGTARPVGRCLGGRKRRRQCEKSRHAAAVQRQRPASWRRAPSVCELLHWLYVHIKPYTSETWAAGFLSWLAQMTLSYMHHDRLSISTV